MTEASSAVRDLAARVGGAAVVVRDHDRELVSAGDTATLVDCRSIRKSLLGALFGRHVADGVIDLDATLAELGIDDSVPPALGEAERSARVRDLLTCRSGVYHPSNHQGPRVRAALPARGAHRPGTHFVYNNWDFNALGTIFEQRAGRGLFDEFAAMVAGPAGMQDFDRARQRYETEPWSEHPSYFFRVSTRDLARFGQLYLCGGDGIIPADWVRASTRAHAETRYGPSYGYLWWVERGGHLFSGTRMPAGSFAAYGTGGQFLLVIPAIDRVVALLADPRRPGGADAAAHRRDLAELVHRATDGAVPLTPGTSADSGPY